jgi:hypothetical protein
MFVYPCLLQFSYLLLPYLLQDYELRKHARSEGRRYCDPVVLTYQAERMPEQIRLKVGGVTHQQIAVYEEFARNIPGFMPAAQEAGAPASANYGRQALPPARKEQLVEAVSSLSIVVVCCSVVISFYYIS